MMERKLLALEFRYLQYTMCPQEGAMTIECRRFHKCCFLIRTEGVPYQSSHWKQQTGLDLCWWPVGELFRRGALIINICLHFRDKDEELYIRFYTFPNVIFS